MPAIGKILLSGLIGGAICAALGFFMFFVLTISDGNRVSEAVAYSLIVGVGCAFLGALIGLAIGIGNLGVIGGAVAGLSGTLCVAAFYIFFVGRPGELRYFLSESRIIFVVLALPTILTGLLTALLKKLIFKT